MMMLFVVAMYVTLVAGLTILALRTESVLKFLTSPRRVFTLQELLLARLIAIVGILCFSVLAVWVVYRNFRI